MNTKPSLSQTKLLTFTTRFNDTRTRSGLDRRSSISPTLISKPVYSGELKAAKDTTRIEPSNPKNASNIEDSFFSKLAINFLSKNLQDAAGISSSNKSTDYDRLVDTATRVTSSFDTKQQHEIVLSSLDKALPTAIASMIKTLFPPSKLSRELFALFTTIFFAWLVGPSVVRETEVNGRKEKSVVYIEKCRFLEQSNCVSMCTHICKIPTQFFIKNSLGMPIYMKPDFDDLSCEMMFGQEPPAIEDDPALKQPCFKLCKSSKRYGVKH
ncbi:Beta-carotene isomerase D27 [Cardamine amara subsp. amara]|uniref:Beta-carotene isomerase D27 n=1 Tax=Cardamine amara subsp. amara TaxID=228776 RepID=A0ABD1BCB5_CARAN